MTDRNTLSVRLGHSAYREPKSSREHVRRTSLMVAAVLLFGTGFVPKPILSQSRKEHVPREEGWWQHER